MDGNGRLDGWTVWTLDGSGRWRTCQYSSATVPDVTVMVTTRSRHGHSLVTVMVTSQSRHGNGTKDQLYMTG